MSGRTKTSLAVVAALLIASAARAVPAANEVQQGQNLNVEDRVKRIIVEQLGVEPERVTPAARFKEDLGADSLDVVELVMGFEEEFGITYPDDAAEKMLTARSAIDFIKATLAKR